jgi:hypothetical protein
MKVFIALIIALTLTGCSSLQSDKPTVQDKPTDSSQDKEDTAKPDKSKDETPGTDTGKPAENPSQPTTKPTEPDNSKPDPVQQDNLVKAYFPEQNQIKYFKGIGNEFAEEKEIIFEMQGNYLPTIVSNGGTSMLRIYKLTDKGIYLVYQQPEYYEKNVPDITTLQDRFKEIPILTEPIAEGRVINGWKIISKDKNLLLPIGSIKKAIVLELVNQDGSITRQYWAPKFGLVKKEFYMKDNSGSETLITSELMDTDIRK